MDGLVNVSSAGHRRSDVDLEDLNFERTPYDELFWPMAGPKQPPSSLRSSSTGATSPRGVRATAVHPGAIQTATVQTLIKNMGANEGSRASAFNWKTVPQGAATSVWAGIVASGEDVGRQYCEDCHVAEVDDDPGHQAGVRSYALDTEHARTLWAKSEALVGEHF